MKNNENDSFNSDGTYHFKGGGSKGSFTDYYDKAFHADPREEEPGAEFAESFHEEINIDMDPNINTKKDNPFQNPNYRRRNSNKYYGEYKDGYDYQYDEYPYNQYNEDINNQNYGYQNQNGRNGQADMNNQNDIGYEDRYTRRNQNNNGGNQYNGNNSQRSYQNRNQGSRQRANDGYRNNGTSRSGNRSQSDRQSSYNDNHKKRNNYDNDGRRNKRNKKGKNKKRFSFKKLILIIILILLLLFGLVSALILHYIGMMNLVDTGDRVANSASVVYSDKVENILIIGSDSRTEDESARSDTMILLSINKSSKQLIQTSFMRDMYVEIPGYGENKLNSAYNSGGAELVMDTIEQNFNIQIDRYIQIDFFSFIDIIDALGGLDIEITKAEAQAMTDPLGEQNKYLGNDQGTDYLTKGGTIHMNGNQALAYARIRHISGTTGTDFGRTDRQRKVLNMVMDKIKDAGLTDINKMLKNVLPEITTNMTKKELYFLALRSPFIFGYDRYELRMPYGDEDSQSDERYWEYGTGSDGSSILVVDFDKNSALLRKTIYGY